MPNKPLDFFSFLWWERERDLLLSSFLCFSFYWEWEDFSLCLLSSGWDFFVREWCSFLSASFFSLFSDIFSCVVTSTSCSVLESSVFLTFITSSSLSSTFCSSLDGSLDFSLVSYSYSSFSAFLFKSRFNYSSFFSASY